MYFEGSEKKIELIVRDVDLREWEDSYWHSMAEAAGAKVLSKITNDKCTAYLLSESSLFVWKDRITMITCGRTTLVNALLHLLKRVNGDQIDFLTYERKNEFYPHEQHTSFHKDMEVLQNILPGSAYRFGFPDEHHLFLYHLSKPYHFSKVDSTLEILMYNLQGPSSEIFSCDQTLERVRELTRVDRIFPGFTIDDHLFTPCGYSLNALKGEEYYTLHVTPEEFGSYVSFETNVKHGREIGRAIRSLVEIFRPRSFDVIHFHTEKELKAFELAPFIQRTHVRQNLKCGLEAGYSTYYIKSDEPSAAVPLEDWH
jgi:S-adenosylmethionine decarboxylase